MGQRARDRDTIERWAKVGERGPRGQGRAGEGKAQERGPGATLDHRPHGPRRAFSFLPRGSCLLLAQSLVRLREEHYVRSREVECVPGEVVGDVSSKQALPVPTVLVPDGQQTGLQSISQAWRENDVLSSGGRKVRSYSVDCRLSLLLSSSKRLPIINIQ